MDQAISEKPGIIRLQIACGGQTSSSQLKVEPGSQTIPISLPVTSADFVVIKPYTAAKIHDTWSRPARIIALPVNYATGCASPWLAFASVSAINGEPRT